MTKKLTIVCLLQLIVFVACSQSETVEDPAQATADAFVKAYYIDISPDKALEFCSGLACHTLKRELKLRSGQEIGNDTKRPLIQIENLERIEAPEDQRRYVYEIKISPKDVESFSRKIYLKMRHEDKAWGVSHFAEMKDAVTK